MELNEETGSSSLSLVPYGDPLTFDVALQTKLFTDSSTAYSSRGGRSTQTQYLNKSASTRLKKKPLQVEAQLYMLK